MSAPPRFRYEPLPPGQPACMGCWQAPATTAVWQGRAWRTSLCAACTAQHRREHRAVQGELWEEEAKDEGREA